MPLLDAVQVASRVVRKDSARRYRTSSRWFAKTTAVRLIRWLCLATHSQAQPIGFLFQQKEPGRTEILHRDETGFRIRVLPGWYQSRSMWFVRPRQLTGRIRRSG